MPVGIGTKLRWLGVMAALIGGAAWWHHHRSANTAGGPDVAHADAASPAGAASGVKPALSVQLVKPQSGEWPLSLTANGMLAAWQETVIGSELGGLRLQEVRVNVGDKVGKGQVLATLLDESVQADLNTSQAALREAEALASEAHANAERARSLQSSGVMSIQDTQRALTTEQTAKARVDSARAQLAAQTLRLRQTRILASDDGVISARQATVGAVVQPGQELFRLIRQGRLEWRAEVPSADLTRVRAGMKAWATPPGSEPIEGVVRSVAPTVDAATRNGLVYVDLPASALQSGARAGMFASGRIDLGTAQGLTLPQSAVLLKEGFSYVFQVDAQGVAHQRKVSTGRRVGDRVEILQGVDARTDVVAMGVGFLTDGDKVRVVKGQP